jgi:hypothetical protein
MREDFAFIRLKPNLEEAINSRESSNANFFYHDQIQLSPNETYSQFTNIKQGIAFGGNFLVSICNCDGKELLDITPKVDVIEINDNKGIPQIRFDLKEIGTDFGRENVLLKFKHTESNAVWFSNLFNITDRDFHKTTRFDYKCYEEFDGVAYNKFNAYQSIRLRCGFKGSQIESESKDYKEYSGIKRKYRLIKTNFEKFTFYGIDNFTYIRLNFLLINQVIYCNDYLVTERQTVESADFISASNMSDISFKLAFDFNAKTLSEIIEDENTIKGFYDKYFYDNDKYVTQ